MNRSRRVGITCNLMPAADRHFYKNKALHYGEESMVQAVERAGGVAVLLPLPTDVERTIPVYLDMVDGLILSGGSDVSPGNYGEDPADARWAGQPRRDAFEMALLHGALESEKRVLGVCRGLQVVNVALGGSLWQDLSTLRPDTRVHRSQEEYDGLGHDIDVVAGTPLADLIGEGRRRVNSVHHQGVRRLAEGMEVWATASADGVVEAIGDPGRPDMLAVQWHPEWMYGDPGAEAVFRWLVKPEE